jgi:hypothetical protein
MNPGGEPRFLTREAVDAIHEDQIDRFGGLHGVRDENALESAMAAAQNVYHYGSGDVYGSPLRMRFIWQRVRLISMAINEQGLKLRSCSSKAVVSMQAGYRSSRLTT